MSSSLDLSLIRTALGNYAPRIAAADAFPQHTYAAVALLLREMPAGLEILYILRAEYEGDPWSGNIALPGGHIEPHDPSPRHTAARETFEELGIDLAQAEYLGRIDDIAGAHLPVIVACFAWLVPSDTTIRHNGEVVKAFWVPLSQLADPSRQISQQVEFQGQTLVRPAIDLLGPGHALLWGITYRLTSHFLELIGISLPHSPLP